VRQRYTGAAESFVADGAAMVVWWGTPVECASALARLARDGHLQSREAGKATRRLREMADRWIEVEPSESLRGLAQTLVSRHSINAADGFQLAAAITFSGADERDVDFVTFDGQLASAARREGFIVP
jgi:hypothetical protein